MNAGKPRQKERWPRPTSETAMFDRSSPDVAVLDADPVTSEVTRAACHLEVLDGTALGEDRGDDRAEHEVTTDDAVGAGNVGCDVGAGTSKTALPPIVPLTRYAGGKNGAGVFQRLINLMPPHRVYVEAFLGSGAVLRRKRPASTNIGIDVDAGVIAAHIDGGHTALSVAREVATSPNAEAVYRGNDGSSYICGDALAWLQRQPWSGDEFVYCDPPYLGTARACVNRSIYRCEMMPAERHAELLHLLTSLPAMVAISGYASALYEQALRGWERIEFQAMTRGGVATEVVWMNYPPPTALHDYRFLGRDFHDRCRIARKIQRWTARLNTLPTLERAAVIAALDLAAGSVST